MKGLLIAALIVLAMSSLVVGQTQAAPGSAQSEIPKLDEIAISPSRVELPMLPGTEKTLVVNLIYTSVTESAAPTRIFAYLGDWDISREGKIGFYAPGTRPNSASPWLIYSPTEETIIPGRTHSIRVTISVPADATPGDHLAALFVEPRMDNIKLKENTKQVQMKFRLASLFYIMVPDLKRKGALDNLKAEATDKAVMVTARLKNIGNSRIRPVCSARVTDLAGMVVAEIENLEPLPLLGGNEMDMPVMFQKVLPSGTYTVQFRADFGEGDIVEGQTPLVVNEFASQKPITQQPAESGAKSEGGKVKQ